MNAMTVLTSSPVVVAATVAVGVGGCRLAGVDPHAREAAVAAAIALVASTLGTVPLILLRRQPWTPTGPAQAALLAMVSYLGVTIILAAATIVAVHAGTPFAMWVLGLFWTTLAAMSATCIRAVRMPPPTTAERAA